MRYLRIVATVTVVLVVAAGSASLQSAHRYGAAPADVDEPFWCAPDSGTALSISDCKTLSLQLDLGVTFARVRQHVSNAVALGASHQPYTAGVGARYKFGPTPSTFGVYPDTLLYDGTDSDSQVAGAEWNVASAEAPGGFIGPNDVWTEVSDGLWRLRVWMLRPFQNQPNVFASTHPCLGATEAVYDLDAPCYTATHPDPLQILVSDDDGYAAPGINAAVQALIGLPNVDVTVVAPLIDRSGTGGTVSPDPLTVSNVATVPGGYPAIAVDGYPADSVRYALETMHENPDLLVSGINRGQNLATFVNISGTVGAARVGGRGGIPAVALSQGLGTSGEDYPAGVIAMMEWVESFLFGREGPARFQSVVNINIPTCPTGDPRGTVEIGVATNLTPNPFSPTNCQSTKTSFINDSDAFINGYVTWSSIGT